MPSHDKTRALLLGAALVALSGCDRIPPLPHPVYPAAPEWDGLIVVSPSKLQLRLNETAILTATIDGPAAFFTASRWPHNLSALRVTPLACTEVFEVSRRRCSATITATAVGRGWIGFSADVRPYSPSVIGRASLEVVP